MTKRFLLSLCVCFSLSVTSFSHAVPHALDDAPASGVLKLFAIDNKSEPVTDLTIAELALQIDKHPRKILSLASAAAEPRNIGLFFDISGSRRSDRLIPNEIEEAAQFLKSIWRPGDAAFVAAFAEVTVSIVPPTSDLSKIEKGLRAIPSARYYGATALYDALCTFHTSGGPETLGETLVIVFGDFEDNMSHFSADAAIQRLRKNRTRVFPLLRFPESDSPKAGKHAQGMAKKVAASTGGDVFLANNAKEIGLAFQRLQAELKGAYRLNYELLPSDSLGRNYQLHATRPKTTILVAE